MKAGGTSTASNCYLFPMRYPASNPIPEGHRFPAENLRIVRMALMVSVVYGGGILTAFWAGYLTKEAIRTGSGLPVLPWSLAFLGVIAGMLSVIYGFFFRPREVRLTEEKVSLLIWDGSGKSMRRDELESAEAGPSRVVLKGGGKTLVVDRRFAPWKTLREEMVKWADGAKLSSHG